MKRLLLFSLIALTGLAACTNYGKKVTDGNIEVYYKDGFTKSEAEKTARALSELDKSNGNKSTRKSFQLTRESDTITLRMVVNEEKARQMEDDAFNAIAQVISEKVFGNKPVAMQLTDKKFKTIRDIAYKEPAMSIDDANTRAFGEKVIVGKTEVYIQGDAKPEAEKLAAYLEDYFKPQDTYSYQLLKDEAGNYTVKMVGNPDKINTLPVSLFEEVSQGICDKVLSVPSVTFEMTDTRFNSLRTYHYPADTGDPDRNN